MTSRVNVKYGVNAPKVVSLKLTDPNGLAHNFTGSTFRLQAKVRTDAGEPTGSALLTLTTGSGISGTLAQGEIIFTLPRQASSGLPAGEYIYDIIRISGGVPVERLIWGWISAKEGVAQP